MTSNVASTVKGVLFEIFVSEFFTVAGISGQKYAIEQQKLRNSSLGLDANEVDADPRTVSTTSTASIPYKTASMEDTHDSESIITGRPVPSTLKTVRSPLWMLSFLSFCIGQASEAVSLTLAPQADIAASANLTLIWSAIFSYYLFDEPFTMLPPKSLEYKADTKRKFFPSRIHLVNFTNYVASWDLLIYSILMLGSLITILTAPVNENDSDVDITPEALLQKWTSFPYSLYIIFILIALLVTVVQLCRKWKVEKYHRMNGLGIAFLAAILSSLTVTLSKMFLTLLSKYIATGHLYNQDSISTLQSIAAGLGLLDRKYLEGHTMNSTVVIVLYVLMFILWLSLLGSFVFVLNLGLASYGQSLIVPVFEISGTLLSISAGTLFYKTYEDFNRYTFTGFLIGVVLMCSGIFFISIREDNVHKQRLSAGTDEANTDNDFDLNPILPTADSDIPELKRHYSHSSEKEAPTASTFLLRKK